jgi:hypothetical protein
MTDQELCDEILAEVAEELGCGHDMWVELVAGIAQFHHRVPEGIPASFRGPHQIASQDIDEVREYREVFRRRLGYAVAMICEEATAA